MLWESRSVQELEAKTAAMGVQYVLARHDFLFDYDRSTLVDDKKPTSGERGEIEDRERFILDRQTRSRPTDKFSLVKVF